MPTKSPTMVTESMAKRKTPRVREILVADPSGIAPVTPISTIKNTKEIRSQIMP